MKYKYLIVFAAIGCLTLAGCSASKDTASQPANTNSTTTAETSPASTSNSSSTETPTTATGESATTQAQYPKLLTVVTNTRTAVEAGDFNLAQQNFDPFEASWSQVEDGIRAKSREAYDAIEENTDRVNAALRSNNKESALAALQALDDTINQIPQ